MFDVQVLRYRRNDVELPEEVLASIAGYYRRVTTAARPLTYLIGTVMLVMLAAVVVQITDGREPLWLRLVSLPLGGGPILLALARVYPNAMRLGSRIDSPARQAALARSICRDHLASFAALLGFLALLLIVH